MTGNLICQDNRDQKVKGRLVLMHKNVLHINAINSAKSLEGFIKVAGRSVKKIGKGVVDKVAASVRLRLISADTADTADASRKGKVGNKTRIKVIKDCNQKNKVIEGCSLGTGQNTYDVDLNWNSELRTPGAFYIKSYMQEEFFLVSLTLEDIPNQGDKINFVCNSWIYNTRKYTTPRIFFANTPYLPSKTPPALLDYRREELEALKGDKTGERQEWERIYDYDLYNDLGNPNCILGGSEDLPYPRRGRTGRKQDGKSEQRSDNVYIPKDESFGHLKSSNFLISILKSASQKIIPTLTSALTSKPEFESFEDVHTFFDVGINLPTDTLKRLSTIPFFKELFGTDGKSPLKFPWPKVAEVEKFGWMDDQEFTREMIAGVNPHIIKRLENFPPTSKLDEKFGDNTSTVTKEQLEANMSGVTFEIAIQTNRLYILDHHDAFYPYLRKINAADTKAYASRTFLFLQDDGTLKPLAIELSSPHPKADRNGPVSDIYLPASEGVEASIWLLAKAYVVVNDSCHHQLISHWLNTHAVVEPFIIATNRHLSVVHPIHKLLLPHYRDTMNINALARNALINANGVIETTFLLGSNSLEFSAKVYKDWVFRDQGLPNDLLKRGMAKGDRDSPHGLRLLIEDYPYAKDGLEIWAAIKSWVDEYVNIYYDSDQAVAEDLELKAFWEEVVNVGHGDLENATWLFKMQNRMELIEACTTLIWIASALHAAVNFGQYPYGGLILNRPTKSRRLMPKKGSTEYDELSKNFEKVYLKTITPKKDTLTDLSVIEILSKHASDEQYLGQRIEGDLWTSDSKAIEAYKRFGMKLAEIDQELTKRNKNQSLKNRHGPVKMPYTLLYPSSKEGLTCRGIPNSISI